MRRIAATLVLSLAALVAGAATRADAAADALQTATDGWNALLQKHVRPSGGVDYVGLKADEPALQAFIKAYAAADSLKSADDATKKAAYINLYNAAMMANLLRYAQEQKIDVASKDFTALEINELKVPGGNIWNGDYKVTVAGQAVNLDDIEHALIRGNAAGPLVPLKVKTLDPRIHAAVNCAAVSCPRVRETAYRPATVDRMLDENLREFLSSDAQFHKASDSKLRANSIVFWYYDDFDDYGKKVGKGGAGGWLAGFVAPTAPDAAWKAKHLQDNFNDRGKLTLKLSSAFDFAYDWRVNDVRNKP